jgi:YidC/Oxa1 family membrane protein insertase
VRSAAPGSRFGASRAVTRSAQADTTRFHRTMEKRLLVALLLSALVFVLYEYLYPPKAARVATTATAVDTLRDTVRAAAPSQAGGVSPTPMTPPAPAMAAQTLDVKTTNAVFTFSNVGATPVAVTMLDYNATRTKTQSKAQSPTPNVVLVPALRYRIMRSKDTLDLSQTAFQAQQSGSTVTFTSDVKGSQVSITYTVAPQGYLATVAGKITGLAANDTSYLIAQLPSTFKSTEADTIDDQNHFAYAVKPVRDDPQGIAFGKLDATPKLIAGPLSWVAARNKYFVVGLLTTPAAPFAEADLSGGPKLPGAKLKTLAYGSVIQPVRNGAFGFELYAGPQEYNRLHALGREFEDVNPYGGFLHGVLQPFATIIVRVMIWMRGALQLNYGWIIIIFGVGIRVLLWPLNQRAMRTSLRMQVLQPEIQAVQERYKNKPEQLQQEVMKVYTEHGLSPLSPIIGCLPMLIPLPILYCLLFVFQNTIAFRGVSFLWLHDISLKDPFFILPAVMGLSSYLVSWIGMRNSPPNPQAKMMTYFFPAMMVFFLMNYSAGLNLYYAVQNLATLPQQWFLSNERAKAAKKTPATARAAPVRG